MPAADLPAIFGPQGVLAAVFVNYEHRPGQLIMAQQVRDALAQRQVTLIEAPTGTGKTIAYLIPSLTAGRKVVISSGTKALQEQIIKKDIPLAEAVLGRGLTTVAMKGRQNYLCLARLQNFLAQPDFFSRQEAAIWKKVERWAAQTKTGDRAELADMPDDYAAWNDVCSSPSTCAGARCRHHSSCFITRLRQRAAKADLVVVNHHLLFADLAVRSGSRGEGQVIPDYDSVIIDEAHQVEETATSHFGTSTSSYRFEEWERDTGRALQSAQIADGELAREIAALRKNLADLFSRFGSLPENQIRLRPHFCDRQVLELLADLRRQAILISATTAKCDS